MIDAIRQFVGNKGRAGVVVRALIGSAGLRVIGMVLGLLVGVQLARGLGPAGYGIYSIAMAIYSIAMLPTEFGLPYLITREVAATAVGDKKSLAQMLGWSVKFVFISSLTLAIALCPFLIWHDSMIDTALRAPLTWGLLLLPVAAAANIASSALRGFHKLIEGQISDLVLRPGLLSALLLVSAMVFGAQSLTPEYAMALNVVAALVGLSYAVSKLRHLTSFDISVPMVGVAGKTWLSSALPLAMGDGMRIISGQLAVLVLGILASADSVGIYRVAAGIYAVATLPSALLNAVCSPMLSALHQEGQYDALKRLNAWMALFLVASGVICLLPFAFAGEQVIIILFGQAFKDSNEVLLILLYGELLAAFIGHPTIVLNMLKHEKVVVKYSTLALALNLIICFLLVPDYGAYGAAIGVVLSQIVSRVTASYYSYKQLGLNTTVFAWFTKKASA